MDPFYITTPIYYVNDLPHLGHAYTTMVADAFARFHRAQGRKTFFLTGTDEHGQKIEEAASKAGRTPADFVGEVSGRFRDMWQRLGIQHDDFIRTTDDRHIEFVRWFWDKIARGKTRAGRDNIYLGAYQGPYCVGCERFYTEAELEGGRCPQHPDREIKLVKEPSYFFRMSEYAEPLIDHIEEHPEFVLPDYRRNEVLSFLRGGLKDLSISRTSFRWGIPVPGDETHVIYVWVDALSNYISALGRGTPAYDDFWGRAVHVIGKDILRFHAVYWPTLLMAAGLPLPRTVLAHGWWTVRGQKMSKSIPATRIDPVKLVDDFASVDAIRYFLFREITLGLDGDFSFEKLIERYSSELANDLGNLVNRTLAMVHKFAGGRVPERAAPEDAAIKYTDRLRRAAGRAATEVPELMEAFSPSRALERIFEFIRRANQYVDETAPWTLAKRDPEGVMPLVLSNFLEANCFIARLIAPFLPDTAARIGEQLGLPEDRRRELLGRWPNLEEWGRQLTAGESVARPEPIFPRIDKDRAAEILARWAPAAPEGTGADQPPAEAPETPVIAIEEFRRLDLRVAIVTKAERIPKADRLLKLTLDVGTETREVVAGIAAVYTPEELVGRRVIFLANLKPTKIRGILSSGMILAAGEAQVLALSALDREAPAGTKVR